MGNQSIAEMPSAQRIYISKLKVKNYRSIGEEVFDFGPEGNLIVGQNNVGKTNIMNVLNLVLGYKGMGPYYQNYEGRRVAGAGGTELYHQDYKDVNRKVEIALTFHGLPSKIFEEYIGQDLPKSLTITIIWPAFEGLIQSAGRVPHEVWVESYKVAVDMQLQLIGKLRQEVSFAHVESLRDYHKTVRSDSDSVLSRLLKYYIPSERPNDPRSGSIWFQWDLFRKVWPIRSQTEEGVFAEAAILNSPELKQWFQWDLFRKLWSMQSQTEEGVFAEVVIISSILNSLELTQLRQDIASELNELTGGQYDVEIKYPAHVYNEDLTLGEEYPLTNQLRELSFYVSDGRYATPMPSDSALQSEPSTIWRSSPASHQGSGLQSMLVLAMIRLLVKKDGKPTIIGIDEPELGLHPHTQRTLILRSLEKFGDQGQLFISTHSPSIAALWHQRDFKDKLIRVRYDRIEGTKVTSLDIDLNLDDLAVARLYLMAAGSDIFFADGVIVVEGPTEVGALPALAKEVLGENLDASNISLVNAGGANNIPPLMRLCDALGIPHYAVFDFDALINKNNIQHTISGLSQDDADIIDSQVQRYKKPSKVLTVTAEDLEALNSCLNSRGYSPISNEAADKALASLMIHPHQQPKRLFPKPEDVEAINRILGPARCAVLSSDFEGVFVADLHTSDYFHLYAAMDKLFNTNDNMTWLNNLQSRGKQPTDEEVLKRLKNDCKKEAYWRILIEDWAGINRDSVSAEIIAMIEKALTGLRQQFNDSL